MAAVTECSNCVLGAQEVNSESSCSVVEDIYHMVKDSNGHHLD